MAFALSFCNETGHVQLAAVVRAFAAELALRQGRPDDARFLMEALALKALAWQARGEQAAAAAALAHAIRLAEPGGYIRIFADLGGQIDGLLAQVAAQGVAPLLVAAIRAAIDPATSQPAEKSWPCSTPAPQYRQICWLAR